MFKNKPSSYHVTTSILYKERIASSDCIEVHTNINKLGVSLQPFSVMRRHGE
jgi:hypothetical protein